MSKQKIILSISMVLTIIALGIQFTEMYSIYVIPGLLIFFVFIGILFLKMEDSMYKFYLILQLAILVGASYFIELKDQWLNWFGMFMAFTIISYIPLLLLSLRRNFSAHALSLLRQHPWINAVVMALGFFLYRHLNVPPGARQMVVIILLATAVIATLFVIERNQKVNTKSFNYLLIGTSFLLLVHALYLSSIFVKIPEAMNYVMIVFTSLAASFSILAAKEYESEKS
jgi:hypothetical protein